MINISEKNFYQKLAVMHVTKVVRFDWSAVFESFCCKILARNRAVLHSVQVSGRLHVSCTIFLGFTPIM